MTAKGKFFSGKPTALDRLVEAIRVCVGETDDYREDSLSFWKEIQKAVMEAQKKDTSAAKNIGKKPKKDDRVSWMGSGDRGYQEFIATLRSPELSSRLTLVDYSINVVDDGHSCEVQIVRVTPDGEPERKSD